MRVVVYLLVFVMCMTSACKPIARTSKPYEDNEPKEKMSWKKKALIVAGAGLAVFGSYKMLKYFDRVIGQDLIKKAENAAISSRPIFKKFRIADDRLPLYKLIAPDSSEHWLVGTMHSTALSLDDLPKNSRLLNAFEEVTTFIPEINMDSVLNISQTSAAQARMKMQLMKTDFNLRQALGDEHMGKLDAEISEMIEHIKTAPDNKEMLGVLSSIERMQPAHVLSILDSISINSAFGAPGVSMDAQLTLKARASGKKILGLEKASEAIDPLLASVSGARPDDAAIDRLRKFIDAGGVTNRIKEVDEARAAYVDGNAIKVNELLTEKILSDDTKKLILDDRNHNWIKSGKIQKNCQHGKKCMVAVGVSHLVGGSDPLIELLTKEGFRIEKVK